MMQEHSHETLIIGAGPAGLAAAMELTKAGKRCTVIEKDTRVGGLAKTYTITEGDLIFRTDNGPHRFFSKNKYLYDFISDVLREQWIRVVRHTQQFIRGSFLDYPVNLPQVIGTLGFPTLYHSARDYVGAMVSYRVFQKPIATFYDHAIANFGYTLADLTLLGYTEKVWGIPTQKLHPDWAKQRIAGLNILAMVKNMAQRVLPKPLRGGGAKSLVDEFYYPEFGSGHAYEAIADRLRASGVNIQTQTQPVTIHHDTRRITSVATRATGEFEVHYSVQHLIESVHVDDFLRLLNPAPPAEVLAAAARLSYRSQVFLFVTLDKEQVTRNQWIYFPDINVPFARMSEMKNFSDKMSPPGKTSVFIEFFCNQDNPIYRMDADDLFELAMPYLEKFGLFTRAEVRHRYVFRGGKDYPVYDLNYEDNMKVVRGYLDRFENLSYIGRPGRFKYTNQDHSLEMGILAARGIIDGKRYQLDAVGAEREYFEKWRIPIKG